MQKETPSDSDIRANELWREVGRLREAVAINPGDQKLTQQLAGARARAIAFDAALNRVGAIIPVMLTRQQEDDLRQNIVRDRARQVHHRTQIGG